MMGEKKRAGFRYGALQKLGFYASYFWYKLILPMEIRSPRFAMWRYEMAYTAHKFRDYEYCRPWNSPADVIHTRFGKFRIRVGTADAANVSPAFERRDLNRLFKVLDRLVQSGKRVLFLDVGGDIGTYSIAVANRFDAASVAVHCFEPIPASCELIRGNIDLNRLQGRVTLQETALMDKQTDDLRICLNTMAPGSSGIKRDGDEVSVRADRLDRIMQDHFTGFDAVVTKIDVEGAEEKVLQGAAGLLELNLETHLMVEDFIDPSIIGYLENSGWTFAGKVTEYNSWWVRT